MKSVKTWGSILIILFGISVSFQWTETVISSKISFLPGLENEKGGRLSVYWIVLLLQVCRDGSYILPVDLIIGTLELFEMGSQLAYSGTFRLVTILKKQVFRK